MSFLLSTNNMELVSEDVQSNIVQLLDTTKNKYTIVSWLIDQFCENYISRNLWCLEEINNILSKIEQLSKNTEIVKQNIVVLALCITSFEKKKNLIYVPNTKYELEEDYSGNSIQYAELDELQSFVDANAYIYFTVLYENLKNATNTKIIYDIIRFLLSQKKSVKSDAVLKLDMIDVLFMLIMVFVTNNDVNRDVSSYVHLCKDIFYYRVKKKNKINRINLLFYGFLIILNKHVKYGKYEYTIPIISSTKSNQNESYEYLYNVFEYDHTAIEHVSRTKNNKILEDSERKRIQMCGFRDKVNEDILVEKMS